MEPRNEGHGEIDEKKIIAVKDPTYVVAKKRLEKNSGLRDSHFEIIMPVRRSSQSQLKSERILSHGTDAGGNGSNQCHPKVYVVGKRSRVFFTLSRTSDAR